MKKTKKKLIAFSFVKWSNEDCKVFTANGIEVTQLKLSYSDKPNRDFEGKIALHPKLKLYWDIEGKFDGNNRDYDLRIEIEVPLTFWERLWNF